jgi:hypothetical protein
MTKTKLKEIFILFSLLFTIPLIFVGCGGDGNNSNTNTNGSNMGGQNNTAGGELTITGFSPAEGKAGETVTITGKNFSTNPANNSVSFNGEEAVVTSSTLTQIIVKIPVKADTGFITVVSGSQSATSSTFFIISPPPEITSFTPQSGMAGDLITITGTNFSNALSGNIVKVGGTDAVIKSSTSTQIITCVPEGADSGPILISVGQNGAMTSTNFIVTHAFAGYYSDGTKTIPSIWIGERTASEYTRIDLSGDETHNAMAYSPVVTSGGFVYTAGSYFDGTKLVPCYWTVKGNTAVRTDIGDGTHASVAAAISVSNGVVYTGGSYFDGDKYIPCYWKDTVRTDLAGDGINDSLVYSIDVSGGKVYLSGFYDDGAMLVACCWIVSETGTTRTDLPGDGLNDSCAFSLKVVNGIIYTSGFYADGSKEIPCYWTINTSGVTRTDLPGDGIHNAYAAALTLFEGTVYIAGFYSDGTKLIPCYWTGSTRTDCYVWFDYPGRALTISISAGTVITAGAYYDGKKTIACVWMNGFLIELPGDGINNTEIISSF